MQTFSTFCKRDKKPPVSDIAEIGQRMATLDFDVFVKVCQYYPFR